MIHSKSVKTRMIIAIVFNGCRAVITFVTGVILARGLEPSGYGNLMFLLGSFMSINMLLDMGSSTAFKTFVSKRKRGGQFYFFYVGYLGLQLFVALLFIVLICPDELFEKIWLGHSLNIVVLAFLAVFMQQKIWQMVGVIGESSRQTGRVQILNVSVAIAYLLIIVCLFLWGDLSVENVLIVLFVQYIIAVCIAFFYLKEDHEINDENSSWKSIFNEYISYCKPLVILGLIGFLYDFADKWLLQSYGGDVQQGYFQISFQFASVALLATMSVLNVFWKEVAEAWEQSDLSRLKYMYRKVSRGLFMISAIIAGFLIPWAQQIVVIVLGNAYADAWMVLAIMFFYPIYQSLGQVGGSMLLATGYTKRYMYLSSCTMLCSIPLTLYVLAPSNNGFISGLDLGALGLALKLVLISIVAVNVQSLIVAKSMGWTFDWGYQIVGIPLMLSLGAVSKMLVAYFMDVDGFYVFEILVPFLLTGFIYVVFVFLCLFFMPWLIGMTGIEIKKLLVRFLIKECK